MFTEKFYVDRRVPFGRFVGSKWSNVNSIINPLNVEATQKQDGRNGIYLVLSARKMYLIEQALRQLKSHQKNLLRRASFSGNLMNYSRPSNSRPSLIGRTKIAPALFANSRLFTKSKPLAARNSFSVLHNAGVRVKPTKRVMKPAKQAVKSAKRVTKPAKQAVRGTALEDFFNVPRNTPAKSVKPAPAVAESPAPSVAPASEEDCVVSKGIQNPRQLLSLFVILAEIQAGVARQKYLEELRARAVDAPKKYTPKHKKRKKNKKRSRRASPAPSVATAATRSDVASVAPISKPAPVMVEVVEPTPVSKTIRRKSRRARRRAAKKLQKSSPAPSIAPIAEIETISMEPSLAKHFSDEATIIMDELDLPALPRASLKERKVSLGLDAAPQTKPEPVEPEPQVTSEPQMETLGPEVETPVDHTTALAELKRRQEATLEKLLAISALLRAREEEEANRRRAVALVVTEIQNGTPRRQYLSELSERAQEESTSASSTSCSEPDMDLPDLPRPSMEERNISLGMLTSPTPRMSPRFEPEELSGSESEEMPGFIPRTPPCSPTLEEHCLEDSSETSDGMPGFVTRSPPQLVPEPKVVQSPRQLLSLFVILAEIQAGAVRQKYLEELRARAQAMDDKVAELSGMESPFVSLDCAEDDYFEDFGDEELQMLQDRHADQMERRLTEANDRVKAAEVRMLKAELRTQAYQDEIDRQSHVHRRSLAQEDLKSVLELARAESAVSDLQYQLEDTHKEIRRLKEKAIAEEISQMVPKRTRKPSMGKRLFDLKREEHTSEPDRDQLELIRYKRDKLADLARENSRVKHLYTVKATVIRVHTEHERNSVEIKLYDDPRCASKNKMVKDCFRTAGKRGDTEFNEEFTVLDQYDPMEGKFGLPTTIKFKVRSGKKTVGYVVCDLSDYWNKNMHSQIFQIRSKKDYTGNAKGQLTILLEANREVRDDLRESVASLSEYLARWCEYRVGDQLEVKVVGHDEIEWAPCEITMLEDVRTYRFKITDPTIHAKLFGTRQRPDSGADVYGIHTAREEELRRRHRKKSSTFEVQLGPPPPPCLVPLPSASQMSRCISSHYEVGDELQVRMLYENQSHGWTDVEVIGVNDNKTYKVQLLTKRLEFGVRSVDISDGTCLDNVDAKDLRLKPEVKPW